MTPASESKAKRRKAEPDALSPNITIEKPELKIITNNFIMAVNCWNLLNSSDNVQRGKFIS